MQLSIVLISWNSLPTLRETLRSLEPVASRRDVEVIWVDNGSCDGASHFVTASYPDVKIKILPENKGVAYARNRGVEMSTGRFRLFLDDDTEVNAEAIDTLVNYLETHPEVGIVGCALRDREGCLQASFKPYPGLWCKISNVLRVKLHIAYSEPQLPGAVIYPTYVIGACQLIRREVFNQVGFLDEAIFYGPEDADLCLRAAQAGWLTAYLPQVSIVHHWRRITSRSLTSPASKAHIRALIHFWRKHRRI